MIDRLARTLAVLVLLAMSAPKVAPVRGAPLQTIALHFVSILTAWWITVPAHERRRAAVWATAIGAALPALFYIVGWPLMRGPELAASCFASGMLLYLAIRACQTTVFVAPFMLAAFSPIFVAVISITLDAVPAWTPVIFDAAIYRVEAAWGAPGFAVGRCFMQWWWLKWPCIAVYVLLPAAEVAALGMYLRARERFRANIPGVLLLAGPLAFLFYFICPAVGPVHVFPADFPLRTPVVEHASVAADALRNAMPSMHVGWAILLWWNMRVLGRWWNRGGLLFLAMTVLATLGTGEHYVLDLIVALPLAFGWQALWERYWLAGATGVAVSALSCALVRLSPGASISPAVLGFAIAAGAAVYSFAVVRTLSRQPAHSPRPSFSENAPSSPQSRNSSGEYSAGLARSAVNARNVSTL